MDPLNSRCTSGSTRLFKEGEIWGQNKFNKLLRVTEMSAVQLLASLGGGMTE